MSAWSHLSSDHLLLDSCSWEARTGESSQTSLIRLYTDEAFAREHRKLELGDSGDRGDSGDSGDTAGELA